MDKVPGNLAQRYPDRAALWDPEKNGGLTPETVAPGSRKQVWWRCERGHSWQARVERVAAGSGCPYCAGKRPIPGENDLATTHPEAAALWSPENPSGPEAHTAGSHKRVLWRCQWGHEWEAVISSVALEGSGCPYCAGKRAIPGQTDLQTLRPEVAAQWDREKNGALTPEQVLPAAHDRVWWRCALGHSYRAAVFARTREKASGCPYCAGKQALAGFNDLQTLRPKLAAQWHPGLNGRLRPEDVTLGSNKRVWWQCAEGHVWQAVVYSRTRKRAAGCPVCAGTVRLRPEAQGPRRTAHLTKKELPGGISGSL